MSPKGRRGSAKTPSSAANAKPGPFEFINYTKLGDEEEKSEQLSKIRSHATFNSYQERRRAKKKSVSDADDADYGKDASALSSRRPIHPKVAGGARGRTRGSDAQRGALIDPRSAKLRRDGRPWTDPKAVNLSQIDPHVLEPFDVLPLRGDADMYKTIRFYFDRVPTLFPYEHYDPHAPLGGKKSAQEDPVWKISLGNEAFFSCVLRVASSVRDRTRGQPTSLETLQYQTEAVRFINKKMSKGNDYGSLLFPIGMAAGMSCASGDPGAMMHLNAVRQIVRIMGGLPNLSHMLQRFIIWADYQVAGTWQMPPSWPNILPPLEELHTPAICAVSAQLTGLSMKGFAGPSYARIYNAVRLMHALDLVLSPEWAPEVAGFTVTDTILSIHHHLVEMISEKVPEDAPVAIRDDALMVKLFAHTGHIFIRTAMHHMKMKFTAGAQYTAQLAELLDDEYNRMLLLRDWSLEALLWILFVGAEAALYGRPQREWYMRSLGATLSLFQIPSKAHFRRVLRRFPWTKGFRPDAVDVVWDEATAVAAAAAAAAATVVPAVDVSGMGGISATSGAGAGAGAGGVAGAIPPPAPAPGFRTGIPIRASGGADPGVFGVGNGNGHNGGGGPGPVPR